MYVNAIVEYVILASLQDSVQDPTSTFRISGSTVNEKAQHVLKAIRDGALQCILFLHAIIVGNSDNSRFKINDILRKNEAHAIHPFLLK